MHQTAVPQEPPAKTARKKSRWTRKRLFIVGGGVAALLLVLAIFSGKGEKPIPVTTEKAERRTIVQTVSATGKVQPEIEVKISPEVAGEIIELPVEDGKEVKKGELLLRIKPDSYRALLEQQQAAISGAKAMNLQAKASMLQEEQDLKRAQDLFNKKLISDSEFVAARTAFDVAKSTFESSRHEIERAEAASSQARDQLSKTTIYSPMDGTVTKLDSKLGERVVATNQFAGTEVMRVADLAQMQAVVDANENDVVKVKIGDKATVTIDAYGDRKFTGEVQQIANTGSTTKEGTQEEVTNFEVKIRLREPGLKLRPGLSCTAEIETNMARDVVSVPLQAVTIRTNDSKLSPEEEEKKKRAASARDKDDLTAETINETQQRRAQREEREKLSKVVFLKEGDKAVLKKVETGIANDAYMEIKSGLNPGDLVISGSYSAVSRKLKDGADVTMEKEAGK